MRRAYEQVGVKIRGDVLLNVCKTVCTPHSDWFSLIYYFALLQRTVDKLLIFSAVVEDPFFKPVPSRQKNALLNEQLKRNFEEKQNSSAYQSMLKIRAELPAYQMRHKIIDAVRNNQASLF